MKDLSPWVTEPEKRRPTDVAIVAIANKLAQEIAGHNREYDKNNISIRPY
ncbi:predicted protein [Escherichia coli B088]|nr:predicted protein [Escherichia coli B088]